MNGVFGRRKGHKLREQQDRLVRDLLPVLTPDPMLSPETWFDPPRSELWLEIGFGGGEHLAAQAQNHPEIGFIGCEPFLNGVAKLLAIIHDRAFSHIRLWHDDALELMRRLPDSSLTRIYLLYPDPWPKWRQRKRRFVSETSIEEWARLLKPGGEVRFATDIDDYAGWTLARMLRSKDFLWRAERADDWRLPWPDWSGTRYESKAVREKRRPTYLTFRRV